MGQEGDQTGLGNRTLHVLGSFQKTLSLKGRSSREKLGVMEAQTTRLLGLPAIEALEVVRLLDVFGHVLDNVVRRPNARIFEGLGTLELEYHTTLQPSTKQFSLNVPRRISIPLLDVVKLVFDDMEREGGI